MFMPPGIDTTILRYAGELANPTHDPYTPACRWVRENVKAGESVVVFPPRMVYSLMYHAPQAVYGWQFSPLPEALWIFHPYTPKARFLQTTWWCLDRISCGSSGAADSK